MKRTTNLILMALSAMMFYPAIVCGQTENSSDYLKISTVECFYNDCIKDKYTYFYNEAGQQIRDIHSQYSLWNSQLTYSFDCSYEVGNNDEILSISTTEEEYGSYTRRYSYSVTMSHDENSHLRSESYYGPSGTLLWQKGYDEYGRGTMSFDRDGSGEFLKYGKKGLISYYATTDPRYPELTFSEDGHLLTETYSYTEDSARIGIPVKAFRKIEYIYGSYSEDCQYNVLKEINEEQRYEVEEDLPRSYFMTIFDNDSLADMAFSEYAYYLANKQNNYSNNDFTCDLQFDEEGRPIRIKYYDRYHDILATEEFAYDEQGNEISHTVHDIGRNSMLFTSFLGSGFLQKCEYDEQNQLISQSLGLYRYSGDRTDALYYITFDNSNDKQHKKEYDASGNLISDEYKDTKYEYSYDGQGNIASEMYYSKVDDVFQLRRQITYDTTQKVLKGGGSIDMGRHINYNSHDTDFWQVDYNGSHLVYQYENPFVITKWQEYGHDGTVSERKFYYTKFEDSSGITEKEAYIDSYGNGEGAVYYNANGQQLAAPAKGLNVIVDIDGNRRKVYLK